MVFSLLLLLFLNKSFADEKVWDLAAKERFLGLKPGAQGSFFLKPGSQAALSSDDGKLKITNEEVVFNGKNILYAELVKKNLKPREIQYIEIPGYPFLKYYLAGKYIQISVNGIGQNSFFIQNGKERYTFSAPEVNMYTGLNFDTYFEPGSKQDDVLKVAKKNKSLQTFLNRMELCSVKKDIECLKELSSDSFKNRLEENVKRRTVFDDKRTCNKFNSINDRLTDDNAVPSDLVKLADKQKTKLWENLKEASLLQSRSNYILFTNVASFSDEIETVTIVRKISEMNPCENSRDLHLVLNRNQEEWKITGLILTSSDGY